MWQVGVTAALQQLFHRGASSTTLARLCAALRSNVADALAQSAGNTQDLEVQLWAPHLSAS